MSTHERPPDDFDDEIEAHLALEADRLVEEGLPPEAAPAEARRRFGSVLAARERFYEARRWLWWDRLRHDLGGAARSLRRYPVAGLVAVLSLAGGIAATTAALAVRDAVFRKPPPLYRAPGRLSRVQVGSLEQPIRPAGSLVPGALFALWHDAPLGVSLAGAAPARERDVRTGDRTIGIPVRAVSDDLFDVLGVEPALGRLPRDRASSAVLSHGAWETLFDGRPDALGRLLWIDGQPFQVGAVMPDRFWFSTMDGPIWLPVSMDALRTAEVEVVARRPSGVSPEALSERLRTGLLTYASGLPSADRRLRLKVSGMEGTPIARVLSVALPWALGTAVLLTLLIACANVAMLVMAQWTSREREIGLRVALGASRGRIVRSLVTESVLIACIGGGLGIGLAFALRALIVSHAASTLRMLDLSIDPHLLLDSFAITFLSGIVAGIGPAVLETRRLHGHPMRTLASSDRLRQRWRHALVIGEVAVTMALLVVAGGLLSTYARQLAQHLGFDSRRLIALRVANDHGVDVARIAEVVTAVPGVAAAAPSTSVPYAGSGRFERVTTSAAGAQSVRADVVSIGPGFFAALGVPLRAGRAFGDGESTATRTALVNERLAARLFGDQSPIGRRVWLRGTSYEILGLVAQYSNYALQNHDRDPKLFLPLDSSPDRTAMDFLVRASGDPAPLVNTLTQEVKRAEPETSARAYTLDQMAAVGAQEILATTALVLPLIAVAMFLTTAGLYGVLAFAIARRARELALRLALGATGRDILRLVSAQSGRLLAIGAGCGVGATFALSRVVRASGGAGSFLDPAWPAFVVPVAIIAVAGAAATWVPSRRALRVDPAQMLRGD